MCSKLITLGANLDQRDENGKTALGIALHRVRHFSRYAQTSDQKKREAMRKCLGMCRQVITLLFVADSHGINEKQSHSAFPGDCNWSFILVLS